MVYKYLALDKWAFLVKIIVKNGGPFKSLGKLWRHDTLKDGILRGMDCYGNKYYENNYYMISRNRWVEYNPLVKFEYDGSQVTAEWFGWLHHKTDRIPSEDCAKYCLMSCCYVHNWLQPHEENYTGTNKSFYPYSTVRPYIKVWDVDRWNAFIIPFQRKDYRKKSHGFGLEAEALINEPCAILMTTIGSDLSLPNVVKAMVTNEEGWSTENLMSLNYVAERFKEEDGAALSMCQRSVGNSDVAYDATVPLTRQQP